MNLATAGLEVERKFWLPQMPPLAVYIDHRVVPCSIIEQAYLPTDEGELRVRKSGRKFFLTKKKGEGLVREETEEEITESRYYELVKGALGQIITKNRYHIRENGHVLEVDEYTGFLAGLAVLECEFASAAAAGQFTLPVWAVGAVEVTEDKKFKNKSLSLFGRPF